MEDPHILRNAAIGCQKALRECLSVPPLNDESWAENKLGDFNLWVTNLRVLKPGHASLDYRLREREDLRNVIAGLLQSLCEFVERCRVPEEPEASNQFNIDEKGSDDSVSSWSDISDEDDGVLNQERASISILSDPISGVETTLGKLISLGMIIRKSGDRFRHDLADRSLEVSDYEEFKRHLEFLLSKDQVSEGVFEDVSEKNFEKLSGKLPEEQFSFVTRQKRLGLVRLTDFQRRAIHANIIRRNRFEFAKKRELKANPRPTPRSKPTQQQQLIQKPITPAPKPRTAVSTPHSKDPEEKSQASISRPSIVETATQIGTITMPTPSEAATRITKMSSTGQKLDYPPCPQLERPEDASFQCPFCYQQLSKKYLEKSRWRSHVHGDIMPYICIFEDCTEQKSFFPSKEQWVEHLRAKHSKRYWQCPFPEICKSASEARFANESDWIDHMATHQSADNQTKFSAAQLRILAGSNIAHEFSIESCPLCHFSSPGNQEETIKHIAEDLHSFALRSLPWEGYVDNDQSAIAQAMNEKAPSDSTDDSRNFFETEGEVATTSEKPDQLPDILAAWAADGGVLNADISPYYKSKLKELFDAAQGIYFRSKLDRDAIRRMEKILPDMAWIIKQLEEIITPSGDLRDETMAESRFDLCEDFENLFSALMLLGADTSGRKGLARSYSIHDEGFIRKKSLAPSELIDRFSTSVNGDRANLMELATKLEIDPGMKVELDLMASGRKIVFRGDLQQNGAVSKHLLDQHVILLDHYFLFTERSLATDRSMLADTAHSTSSPPPYPQEKASNERANDLFLESSRIPNMEPFTNAHISGSENITNKHEKLPFEYHAKKQTIAENDTRLHEKYKVTTRPIPMDLLVLETIDDDPVVATMTPQGMMTIPIHRGPGSSTKISGGAPNPENATEKILFPFQIKQLGLSGNYVLYTPSSQSRSDWCQKISEAKTNHAANSLCQSMGPFRLRVLEDLAFAYPDKPWISSPKSMTIRHIPLYNALEEFKKKQEGLGPRQLPVCKTQVNCATAFQQESTEVRRYAVGTDLGVWISDVSEPGGWYRAIAISLVTQIAVLEEFNLLLFIADHSLITYHLDDVCPPDRLAYQSQYHKSNFRGPQKVSGARQVGFFALGRMKDQCLVFYEKRDRLGSTFKVLELIHQSSSTKNNFRELFRSRRSTSEFFREFDEFYIPAQGYNINIFHSSLAISTHRGMEVLTLDKKQSWSVPDFRPETSGSNRALTLIATRVKDLRPLGMFRVSEIEFLVVYQDCAVYVNKHGIISRNVVMEFVGSADTACLYGGFLILFHEDFVEVRNSTNGQLRQVIPGRNIICLDDGSKMPLLDDSIASPQHTVKICMQHPEFENSQIVLELVEKFVIS